MDRRERRSGTNVRSKERKEEGLQEQKGFIFFFVFAGTEKMVSPREAGSRCLGVVDGAAVSANILSMIQHRAACRDVPRAGFIMAKMDCRQRLSKARAGRGQRPKDEVRSMSVVSFSWTVLFIGLG